MVGEYHPKESNIFATSETSDLCHAFKGRELGNVHTEVVTRGIPFYPRVLVYWWEWDEMTEASESLNSVGMLSNTYGSLQLHFLNRNPPFGNECASHLGAKWLLAMSLLLQGSRQRRMMSRLPWLLSDIETRSQSHLVSGTRLQWMMRLKCRMWDVSSRNDSLGLSHQMNLCKSLLASVRSMALYIQLTLAIVVIQWFWKQIKTSLSSGCTVGLTMSVELREMPVNVVAEASYSLH